MCDQCWCFDPQNPISPFAKEDDDEPINRDTGPKLGDLMCEPDAACCASTCSQEEISEVCADDGETYSEECSATCNGHNVECAGACPCPAPPSPPTPSLSPPPLSLSSPPPPTPTNSTDDDIIYEYSPDCKFAATCESADVLLVCGVDGKTYANACVAFCQETSTVPNCAGRCPCSDDDPCKDVGEDEGLVCGTDGETYANECTAKNQGAEIECEGECPCSVDPDCESSCLELYDENLVCGMDKITYKNGCIMITCYDVQPRCAGACEDCLPSPAPSPPQE